MLCITFDMEIYGSVLTTYHTCNYIILILHIYVVKQKNKYITNYNKQVDVFPYLKTDTCVCVCYYNTSTLSKTTTGYNSTVKINCLIMWIGTHH